MYAYIKTPVSNPHPLMSDTRKPRSHAIQRRDLLTWTTAGRETALPRVTIRPDPHLAAIAPSVPRRGGRRRFQMHVHKSIMRTHTQLPKQLLMHLPKHLHSAPYHFPWRFLFLPDRCSHTSSHPQPFQELKQIQRRGALAAYCCSMAEERCVLEFWGFKSSSFRSGGVWVCWFEDIGV